MFRHRGVFGREPLRLAAVAGSLSTMLLSTAKPMPAANPAQEQVSKDFQQTVTLGAGQSVRVDHKFGSVRLHGESGRDVKISATIRAQASSHEEARSEEHTSELQSPCNLVCRLLLEKKKNIPHIKACLVTR